MPAAPANRRVPSEAATDTSLDRGPSPPVTPFHTFQTVDCFALIFDILIDRYLMGTPYNENGALLVSRKRKGSHRADGARLLRCRRGQVAGRAALSTCVRTIYKDTY